MDSSNMLLLAGLGGLVVFLRPRFGLLLLVVTLPLGSEHFAVKTPIQEIGPTEMVFYPLIARFIVQVTIQRINLKLKISKLAIVFFSITLASLFLMNSFSKSNVIYVLAFCNVAIFCFVIGNYLTNIELLKKAITVHLSTAAICIALEIVSFAMRPHRIGYLISSPNQFASYLLSVAFLALSCIRLTRGGIKPYLLKLILLMTFVAIALTASRAGIFCAGVGLLGFILLTNRKPRHIVVYLFLIGISVGTVVPIVSNLQDESYHKVYVTRFSGLGDSSSVYREILIRESLRLFGEHPIWGNGPGTFSMLSDVPFSQQGSLTHNFYLDILVSYGLLGLLFFVLFLLSVGFRLASSEATNPTFAGLKAGVFAAYLSTCLHLLFFNGGFEHQFWFVVALAQVLPLLSESRICSQFMIRHWCEVRPVSSRLSALRLLTRPPIGS